MRLQLLTLALMVSSYPAWGQEVVYTYRSLVGQPMSIKVEGKEIGFSVGDVTQGSTHCSDPQYVLCFFTDVIDAAIPIIEPSRNQTWEVLGTRFEEVVLVPELRILGSIYQDVHVIRATRLGRRKGLAAVTFTNIYYSYDSGLLGFLYATSDNETIFFSATFAGIKRNP